MTVRYPGCHGVLIEPEEIGLGLGWVRQLPPRRVKVEVVDHVDRRPGGQRLWQMQRRLIPEHPIVRAEMWRQEDGLIWFGNWFLRDEGRSEIGRMNVALTIDERQQRIAIASASGNGSSIFEALASVALPALAQRQGSLVLHASACSHDGAATLVTAPGGSGKSSLLTALIAAGWEAISEDQCVVDLSIDGPTVWPGANWVRVRTGVPVPPPIRNVRFHALDKIGWDVDPWTRRSPCRVALVVFLEPPGEPLWEPVDAATTIGMLARQSPWHQGFDVFNRGVFAQLVDFAMQVPAYRMRLRRSAEWLDEAVALVRGARPASFSGAH